MTGTDDIDPPAPDEGSDLPAQAARLVPTVGVPDMNDPSLDGAAIVAAALARQAADQG